MGLFASQLGTSIQQPATEKARRKPGFFHTSGFFLEGGGDA
jgi:hypothetical protein